MMQMGIPPLTRGVKWLGIVTLAVSILTTTLGDRGDRLRTWVHFSPGEFFHGSFWTPLTYTFLNPQPFSLLFALLGLWLIGSALEQMWGTRRFVTFYFVTSAVAALATAAIGYFAPSVRVSEYYGNWAAIEGLIAAFAVLLPNAQIYLYFLPVRARWMLPISAGITVLFMLMTGWQPYLPQLFGLGAGAFFAGGVAPRNLLLRIRVWWIDRRLRRSKLRVVRGKEDDAGGPFSGGGRGSDKYLH
jgi:membrane associated rhomboid family serine protease